MSVTTPVFHLITVPDKPTNVLQISATTQSVAVSVIVTDETDIVVIFNGSSQVESQNCLRSQNNFTCNVTDLKTGHCYNWSAKSVLNGRFSVYATLQNGSICTCKYYTK